MISPNGNILGAPPKGKHPFWEDGEDNSVNRIYLTATVDDGTGTPAVDSSKTISGNDIIFGLAFKNLKGAPGANGRPGDDGFSPTATITQDADGATISITDKNGTTTARITNGTPGTTGTPGEDGYSPTASIEPITGGFRLTITDENGSHSVDIMNGTNGTDGDDGFSPIATVEQTGENELTITITDAQGTTSATLTGEAGRPGAPGTPGEPGAPGADGFSPIATVTQTATGAEISVTDKNGTTTATVNNGTPGTPGTPGVSPTARVDQTGTNEATITVTDAQGTTTARLTGQAGTPGTPGADGFSPIATVTQTSSGAEISITDRNGTTTATVNNGTPGTPGQQGTPGVGVPTGGTAGQVLAKVDGTDYNTEWVTPQGGGGGLSEIYSRNLSSVGQTELGELFEVMKANKGKTVLITEDTAEEVASSTETTGGKIGFSDTPSITGIQSVYNQSSVTTSTAGTISPSMTDVNLWGVFKIFQRYGGAIEEGYTFDCINPYKSEGRQAVYATKFTIWKNNSTGVYRAHAFVTVSTSIRLNSSAPFATIINYDTKQVSQINKINTKIKTI